MPNPSIVVTDAVTPAVAAVIGGGLDAFNDGAVGYADRKPLAVVARGPATGAVLGGAMGRSSLGLLFLELFHLPPGTPGRRPGERDPGGVRGRAPPGLGGRRAVHDQLLGSFQAPGFHRRHGWRRFGEVACLPPGTSRVFLSKRL